MQLWLNAMSAHVAFAEGKTSHKSHYIGADPEMEVLPLLFAVPKEAWSCSELARGDCCGQLGVSPPQSLPCPPRGSSARSLGPALSSGPLGHVLTSF